MKTNTSKNQTHCSVVLTSTTPATAVVRVPQWVIGLDLGDVRHHLCVLDSAGQIVREAALLNSQPALLKLLAGFPGATVAV